MRAAMVIAAIVLAVGGCCQKPPTKPEPEIDYVTDVTQFKEDGDPSLSPDETKALSVAKAHLEKEFGLPVKGALSVARSRTGYQVDFHDLQTKAKDGQWHEVVEGFGEVFLSPTHEVVRADIGP